MRSAILAAALLAISFSSGYAEPEGVKVLHLKEIPEHGNLVDKDQDCLATKNCTADIKSSILITPDVSAVSSAGRALTAEQSRAITVRQHLNRILAAMNRSLEISRQMIEASRDETSTLKLSDASDRFENERREMLKAASDAVRADPERFGLLTGENPYDVLPPTFGLAEETGAWVRKELERSASVLSRIDAGYKLRLAAFRLRAGADPTPVHLPNYDRFESRAPSQVERISLNITPAQQEQLQKDVAATAALASEIRSNFANLLAAAQISLKTALARLQSAESALTDLRDNLTRDTVQQSLSQLDAQLNQSIAAAADAHDKKVLQDVKTSLAELRSSSTTISNDIQASLQLIHLSRTSLQGLTTGVAADRPDLVLLRILDVGSKALAGFPKPASDLKKHLESFTTAATHFQTAAAALPAGQAQREIATTLAQRFAAEATAILKPIEDLDVVQKLLEAIPAGGKTAQAIATASNLLSYQEIFDVTADQVVPTTLEIPRADADEGDLIEVVAEIRRPGGDLVYEERRVVRPRYFGFHSGVTSGLVFVRASKKEQADLEPEAAAIWRIAFQRRPSESLMKALVPSVGIHVTTLHFGENQIEFGTGVSVHLWRDILQAGVGLNLGVKKDRSYYYGGIGILPLLREHIPQLTGR